MVWVAHREPIEKRGKMQTLVYSMNKLGQIVINVLILFGFSGPMMNCPGYEPDPSVPCSNNQSVLNRVDKDLLASEPYSWCHELCSGATFDFDLEIPEFALSICFVIVASLPLYLRLKEEKADAEPIGGFLHKFWTQLQRRAAWQVILYGMISHITFGVMNAGKCSVYCLLTNADKHFGSQKTIQFVTQLRCRPTLCGLICTHSNINS